MIKSTYNNGFILIFENGFRIHVQIARPGIRNDKDPIIDMKTPIVEAFTGNVTIYDSKEKLIPVGDQPIQFYQSPDQIADWIRRVKEAKIVRDISREIIPDIEEAWE